MTDNYDDIVQQWRADNPKYKNGVVLIWDGTVYGWKNELRDPGHERPGAVAVDASGRVYTACGGSYQDGAAEWVASNIDRSA